MNIVILDLEWNGSFSRRKKKYVNEIIEFGAVKCDEDLNVIDTFSLFVKPQISKKLSSIIKDLTTITDDNLTDGVTFMRAASLFRKWAGDSVVMTWGTADILALVENFRYFNDSTEIPFLSYYCDLQAYADRVVVGEKGEQPGLLKVAELLGVDFSEITHHRAAGDSIVTLKVLEKIYDKEKIKEFIKVCDKEFYDRITFKTTYISDIKSPKIRRSYMRFICPKCKGKCERGTDWQVKNKSFRADFKCASCGYVFSGRVTLKEKYEGIVVNKKAIPIAQIEEPRKPQPGMVENMELEIAENGVGVLKFPELKEEGLAHGFSSRIGGVSAGEFAAMNLGYDRGDPEENVQENYRLFAAALDIDPSTMVTGNQDHNINIRRVGKAEHGIGIWMPKDMKSVDGLCTNQPDTALVIYCADCVPVYYYDKVNRAIGLAHAGWKGTAAGMARAMVEKMQAEFNSKPEDIRVYIGPSISRDSFEVDEPVASVFAELENSSLFVDGPDFMNKYHVDLWECNRQFLLKAGISPENIKIGGVCTVKNSDLVFSHRKTRGKRGSNAALLMLRG